MFFITYIGIIQLSIIMAADFSDFVFNILSLQHNVKYKVYLFV